MSRVWPVTFITASIAAASARAIDVPDYDFEWAVIGDPGNREATPFEAPLATVLPIGTVHHVYRMSTLEVTVEQWMEFVEAYLPFYYQQTGKSVAPSWFTSTSILIRFGVPEIREGRSPLRAADMNWEYAARYCNWLHNGKVNELWAFETGAYDTSTFYEDDDGVSHHQAAHNPGATFWIPTRDEWIKAAYYDPNRYGQGIAGYWRFPDRSNTEPVANLLPGQGGERNSGYNQNGDTTWPLDVASFPSVVSPWGLLDCAGGVAEHTDEIGFNCCGHPPCPQNRNIRGSTYFEFFPGDLVPPDIISSLQCVTVRGGGSRVGLRVASAASFREDFAPPYGVLDLADIVAYIDAFLSGEDSADYAPPIGVLDSVDVLFFAEAFLASTYSNS